MTKVTIIGAGLGGLLCGAHLTKRGYEVEIYEKQSVYGGRFRNIDIGGYQLSTGAIHTAPHGNNGPFSSLLRGIDSEVEILDFNPSCVFWIDNEEIEIKHSNDFFNLFSKFSLYGKLRFLKFFTSLGFLKEPKGNISTYSWLDRQLKAKFITKMTDHFLDWSVNQDTKSILASEFVSIMKAIKKYGGPGLIKGGCQSVVNDLISIIKSEGGEVHLNNSVSKIKSKDSKIESIKTKDGEKKTDLLISDIGPKETFDKMIIKEDKDISFERNIPTSGLKFNLGFKNQILDRSTVYITCDTNIISGFVEVTNADPTLAPKGRHLIITHQASHHKNIDRDILDGKNDIQNIFGKTNYDLLLIQSYKDGWPVNRAYQGQYIRPKTDFKNMYLVGDGVKGKGGIEIEGISMNVREVIGDISHKF